MNRFQQEYIRNRKERLLLLLNINEMEKELAFLEYEGRKITDNLSGNELHEVMYFIPPKAFTIKKIEDWG